MESLNPGDRFVVNVNYPAFGVCDIESNRIGKLGTVIALHGDYYRCQMDHEEHWNWALFLPHEITSLKTKVDHA